VIERITASTSETTRMKTCDTRNSRMLSQKPLSTEGKEAVMSSQLKNWRWTRAHCSEVRIHQKANPKTTPVLIIEISTGVSRCLALRVGGAGGGAGSERTSVIQ
jgi:carbamoylphosphate synthase large subunit